MIVKVLSPIALVCALGFAVPAAAPRFVLVEQQPTPVITTRTPGANGNKYGFEGGRVFRVRDTYHLFTSEMIGDPIWVKMRLAHWRSALTSFRGSPTRAALSWGSSWPDQWRPASGKS